MAAMMKAAGIERRTARCVLCYRMIPNGLFEPARVDIHYASCPGPEKASGSNGFVPAVHRAR